MEEERASKLTGVALLADVGVVRMCVTGTKAATQTSEWVIDAPARDAILQQLTCKGHAVTTLHGWNGKGESKGMA